MPKKGTQLKTCNGLQWQDGPPPDWHRFKRFLKDHLPEEHRLVWGETPPDSKTRLSDKFERAQNWTVKALDVGARFIQEGRSFPETPAEAHEAFWADVQREVERQITAEKRQATTRRYRDRPMVFEPAATSAETEESERRQDQLASLMNAVYSDLSRTQRRGLKDKMQGLGGPIERQRVHRAREKVVGKLAWMGSWVQQKLQTQGDPDLDQCDAAAAKAVAASNGLSWSQAHGLACELAEFWSTTEGEQDLANLALDQHLAHSKQCAGREG